MPRAAPLSRLGLASTATVGFVLSGCAADNDRLTLGGARGDAVTLTSIEPGPALSPASQPSVTGADRSHWPETLAPVPMDVPADHGFTVNTRRWSNPRHGGRFPTPTQAVTIRTGESAWSGPNSWQRFPSGAPGTDSASLPAAQQAPAPAPPAEPAP